MKNIVIFGGAGFIGTNLTKRMLHKKYRVLSIDNLSTSTIDNTLLFNNDINYTFVKGDVTNKAAILDIINIWFDKYHISPHIDEIYNLACPASPPKYQIDPIHTLDTCIATKYICQIAQKFKCKMLHASTSEVYGDPLVHPQTEVYRGNVNTIGPRSCYDEGKRVAETYCYEYRKFGVDVKLVRIFNTYGPYMNPEDGRVVSNFIMEMLRNDDITIYGDGTQTRSFQYIDDLLDGFERLINSDYSGPFNIGNPGEFTIRELVDIVKKEIPDTKSFIVYNDLPIDDPTQRKPDITKAKQLLDWSPKINVHEGIKHTVKYFKENFLKK